MPTVTIVSLRARVAREVAQRVVDPAVAAELAGDLAGGRQRVERLAGDDRVREQPQHGRSDHEQEEPGGLLARDVAREPQPVHAAEQPRLRAQQAGEGEQHEHRPPGARAAQLQQRRAEDQQVEGQVEHRAQREQLHVGPREHHREGDEGDRAAEQALGEREHDREEADVAEQPREHEHAVGPRPERRQQEGDERRERVRRRRAQDVVVGQRPVPQLLAPDQRVVRVVVGIRLPDHEDQQHADQARGEQELLRGRAAAACGLWLGRAGPRRIGLRHGHARRVMMAAPLTGSRRAGGSPPPAPGARTPAARS